MLMSVKFVQILCLSLLVIETFRILNFFHLVYCYFLTEF
jgi:hypothetical protein